MAVRYQRAVAKLAILVAFLFGASNIVTEFIYPLSHHGHEDRRLAHRLRHRENNKIYRHDDATNRSTGSNGKKPLPVTPGSYFNLSCPFEWSKYSCAYMQRGPKAEEIVRASTNHYLKHADAIRASIDRAVADYDRPRRVFFTGDSLMRQLFVGIACSAWSSSVVRGKNLIERAEIPWKEKWPCGSRDTCFVAGGPHSGFDAASIRLVNGMELHYVPHKGFVDEYSAETNVLERLKEDIAKYGRVTFGEKTAMPPGGPNVDVLIYNVGIHYGLGQAKKNILHFANWIVKPLMEQEFNANNTTLLDDGTYHRPRTIYVTTPAQHYNTNNGQWQTGMTKESKQCVDEIPSNPRAELEKELLVPGVNVDVLLDYDDLNLGKMHVHKGHDCSHYCMPGVPDVVAARLLEEFLV